MATQSAEAPNRVNKIALDYSGFGAHRDEFTLQDHLGRRLLIRAIGEVVAKDKPPMVLGLHGDWGSGKSSALRSIRYHLTNDNALGETVADLDGGLHSGHVVTVWFEAWRYQNEPAPVVALIQEIRRGLSLWQRGTSKAKKLGTVAAESLLNSLDKAAKLVGMESLPVSAKDIQSIGEKYERDNLETRLPTDSVQEYLRQAIGALLPHENKNLPSPRVVVFIDDLDRCSAESAYRLLEGLKIYLSLDNCVFVLGMNQQVVIEALAERMKKDDKTPP
jgi:predicted KAP-like P-loop ATPase